MTAKRSIIGTSVAAGQPPWQLRWARQENDRRQRTYEAALAAWRRRDDQLVRLRIEAAGFLGCTQPRTGLPVDLADDEVLYRVLPAAELVEAEARHLPGLPAATLALATAPVDAPDRSLPPGLRLVDTGMAVVTNLRVAFGGRAARREWRHTDLRGPGHHRHHPITLLHTSDGRRPAGLRVPAGAAVNFRFYLTLAFAAATGQRAGIAPQVDALLAAHRAARPVPLPRVRPEDAPAPLLRPERLAAAGVVALALMIGVLAAASVPGPADLPYRAEPGAGGPAASPDGHAVGDGRSATTGPAGPASDITASPADESPSGSTDGGSVDGIVPGGRTAATRSAAPAAVAARPAPTTGAGPTGPATIGRPDASPGPSKPAPSALPPLLAGCLRPLQLPLVDALRCPATG